MFDFSIIRDLQILRESKAFSRRIQPEVAFGTKVSWISTMITKMVE